ncbi:hypothetical protein [Novosphingobium resinovorum]|uniref:hypothetical protein n=1 Tax=Novosphingobium resinovorum TaxID=158500 RepID=UPI002ED4FAAC|nr:hypothetical protein [Novosphingobium resinovorum]
MSADGVAALAAWKSGPDFETVMLLLETELCRGRTAIIRLVPSLSVAKAALISTISAGGIPKQFQNLNARQSLSGTWKQSDRSVRDEWA